MTLESKLKEIKERAEKATTMTNYKGESHPSDSCTDPSVCMAKTDVPMLLAALDEALELIGELEKAIESEVVAYGDSDFTSNTLTKIKAFKDRGSDGRPD